MGVIGVGERRSSGGVEHFDELPGGVVFVSRGGACCVGAARELSGSVVGEAGGLNSFQV